MKDLIFVGGRANTKIAAEIYRENHSGGVSITILIEITMVVNSLIMDFPSFRTLKLSAKKLLKDLIISSA